MEENVIEKIIIPYNPSAAKVVQKDKYQLFAPITKNGQVGMAAFDPRHFQIENRVVSFRSGIAERLEIIYGENGTLAQPKDGSIVKRLNELEKWQANVPELAPTLNYNEEGKVPSVMAVNRGLAKKQDSIGFVVVNDEICMVIEEDN